MKKLSLRKHAAKLAALILSAAMLAGCAGAAAPSGSTAPAADAGQQAAAPAATASADNELIIGLQYDFGDISPFGSVSMGRSYTSWNYERLAVPVTSSGDSWQDMHWQLAKNIEKIDDYTYDVEIYDYITDVDGNHITADDIVFCYQTQLDKKNDENISNYLESVTKTGDYSVEFKLAGLGINTIEYILYQVCIVSEKAYNDSGNGLANSQVSTGAYKVDSFTAGSQIVWSKRDDYWQTDASKIAPFQAANWEKITMKCITESSQMTIALQDGTIDLAVFINTADLGNFMDENGTPLDGYISEAVPGGAFVCLLYNCDAQSPMSDVNLRKAVSYAVDANAIIKAAIDGKGGILNAFCSPTYGDYQKEAWESRDYFSLNVDTAKEYLGQSNYNNEKLVIAYETSEQKQKIAQIIQAELAQAGIDSEIVNYDTALFDSYKYDPAQWDILIDQKGSANGFVTFPWGLCFAPGAFELGTANFIQDDELVRLYNEACSAETHSDETVQAFEQYLDDNAFVYGLYYNNSYAVGNANKLKKVFLRATSAIIPSACE